MMAIGDKPKKADCTHFGYIKKDAVIIWDTDQALRFVGAERDDVVELFTDPELTDKIGDASVEGENDPTVEPFPIFRKTKDGVLELDPSPDDETSVLVVDLESGDEVDTRELTPLRVDRAFWYAWGRMNPDSRVETLE